MYRLPCFDRILYMNDDQYQATETRAMDIYHRTLWKEDSKKACRKQYLHGNRSTGLMTRRLRICKEIFEKASMGHRPNNREHRVLVLQEMTESGKLHAENTLIRLALLGKVPLAWLNHIDMDSVLICKIDQAKDIKDNKKEGEDQMNPQICSKPNDDEQLEQ